MVGLRMEKQTRITDEQNPQAGEEQRVSIPRLLLQHSRGPREAPLNQTTGNAGGKGMGSAVLDLIAVAARTA